MDRRLHERVNVQFEARITNLNDPGHSACGTVSDISRSGISVTMPMQLATGDMVELEMADSTLCGHVVYCNPEGALFRTGVEVELVRLGETALSQLLQRTLIEAMPSLPGIEPAQAYADN